jgi:hypothetical protein
VVCSEKSRARRCRLRFYRSVREQNRSAAGRTFVDFKKIFM